MPTEISIEEIFFFIRRDCIPLPRCERPYLLSVFHRHKAVSPHVKAARKPLPRNQVLDVIVLEYLYRLRLAFPYVKLILPFIVADVGIIVQFLYRLHALALEETHKRFQGVKPTVGCIRINVKIKWECEA